jgi:hypothetical protein
MRMPWPTRGCSAIRKKSGIVTKCPAWKRTAVTSQYEKY